MGAFFKKIFLLSLSVLATLCMQAQCSICTKTASQLGEDAARGLNAGILYLAAAPFLVVGYIGYRWWKNNRD
jgi:hypothetical protein